MPQTGAKQTMPLKTDIVDSTQVDDLIRASKSMGLSSEMMRQLNLKKRILEEAEKLQEKLVEISRSVPNASAPFEIDNNNFDSLNQSVRLNTKKSDKYLEPILSENNGINRKCLFSP